MTRPSSSSTCPVSPRWRHPSGWRASSWLVAVQVAVVSVLTFTSVLAQASGRVAVSWWLLLLLVPFAVAWWGERVQRRVERAARARVQARMWRAELITTAAVAAEFGVDLDGEDDADDGAGLAPYEVCDCAWCGGSVDGEPAEVTGRG